MLLADPPVVEIITVTVVSSTGDSVLVSGGVTLEYTSTVLPLLGDFESTVCGALVLELGVSTGTSVDLISGFCVVVVDSFGGSVFSLEVAVGAVHTVSVVLLVASLALLNTFLSDGTSEGMVGAATVVTMSSVLVESDLDSGFASSLVLGTLNVVDSNGLEVLESLSFGTVFKSIGVSVLTFGTTSGAMVEGDCSLGTTELELGTSFITEEVSIGTAVVLDGCSNVS